MGAVLSEYLGQLTDPFLNPQKRVFAGYLFSALAIAFVLAMMRSRGSWLGAWRSLFSRDIWWSKSARADYLILLINQAVMMGVVPRLITKLALATLLFEAMHVWFDGRLLLWPSAHGWMIPAAFTVSLFYVL